MQPSSAVVRVLVVAIATLSACTSVQVSQDYDPRAAAYPHDTWQWEEPAQPTTGDLRIDNPLLNDRIRRAIHNHMAAHDIAQTREQPDLYISYRLVIQPKLNSYSNYTTMGMGGYFYPWYWDYDADTHIYQYDECQLTVDIKGTDEKTLLWRGTGIYRCQTYKTPEAAMAAMQRTVDKILDQFPPAVN